MSEFLKPQSPLKHKDGAYIYPLTTADQVILENGNRLNTALNDMSSKPKAGFIYPLASSIVPEGFLLCDGAEYSRTEYVELFAAIGTIYGTGDGSTTFNVPNLQTRVPVGAGNEFSLGTTGGEVTHTLTVDEMPAHTHQFTNNQRAMTDTAELGGWGSPIQTVASNDYLAQATQMLSTGGNQPHNNMQPYTIVNYIIATGKDTGVSVSDIVLGAQAIPLGVEYGGTGATNAEDALKNIGALSMELVWENASPNSTFAAQTISLDLSHYSMILVFAIPYISWGDLRVSFMLRIHDGNDRLVMHHTKTDNSETWQRNLYKTANGISVEAGYINGNSNNGALVPTAIYGIK